MLDQMLQPVTEAKFVGDADPGRERVAEEQRAPDSWRPGGHELVAAAEASLIDGHEVTPTLVRDAGVEAWDESVA